MSDQTSDTGIKNQDNAVIGLIAFVSIAVVGLVTLLYFTRGLKGDINMDLTIFPKFHAIVNSLVSILLIAGLYFIKQKNIIAHKRSMFGALLLSAIFLISYVTYHSLSEPTTYGGDGILKFVYYFILITHIFLAAIILPFILLTVYRALKSDIARHKKIAKWTWPVWFYVSVTGVLVYLLISPYY